VGSEDQPLDVQERDEQHVERSRDNENCRWEQRTYDATEGVEADHLLLFDRSEPNETRCPSKTRTVGEELSV